MPDEMTIVDRKPHDMQINTEAPPMVQIVQMMASGIKVDVEQIKAIQEICQLQDADDARKVYASDFAIAQASIAAVVKTKVNPQTRSNYAGLEDVLSMSKPVYTKYGFSVVFYEGVTEAPANVRVCADVLHKDGHKETYHLDVPLGGVGIQGKVNMTAIHAKATSVTYGRRYLLCMIWNIPTQDDDGNNGGDAPPVIDPPTEAQSQIITAICDQYPAPDGKRADPEKVGRLFLAGQGSYPSNPKRVEAAVEWLVETGRPVCIPDNRSTFEKDNDMPGDEDSVPDEPQELRYYCNDCSSEYDNAKKKGQCPVCLRMNVVDRKPE